MIAIYYTSSYHTLQLSPIRIKDYYHFSLTAVSYAIDKWIRVFKFSYSSRIPFYFVSIAYIITQFNNFWTIKSDLFHQCRNSFSSIDFMSKINLMSSDHIYQYAFIPFRCNIIRRWHQRISIIFIMFIGLTSILIILYQKGTYNLNSIEAFYHTSMILGVSVLVQCLLRLLRVLSTDWKKK